VNLVDKVVGMVMLIKLSGVYNNELTPKWIGEDGWRMKFRDYGI